MEQILDKKFCCWKVVKITSTLTNEIEILTYSDMLEEITKYKSNHFTRLEIHEYLHNLGYNYALIRNI